MLAHVGGQHHVDHHLPHGAALLGGEGGEDIAGRVLQDLGSHGQVVILQHALVVIHQRQLRTYTQEALLTGHRILIIPGIVCLQDEMSL